jgi:transposase-like protein
MEIHQGKKRFNCEYCDRRFFTKFNLNSHLKTHKKEMQQNKKQEIMGPMACEKQEPQVQAQDQAVQQYMAQQQ